MHASHAPSTLLLGKSPRLWSQAYDLLEMPQSAPKNGYPSNQMNRKTILAKHNTTRLHQGHKKGFSQPY